MCIRDRMNTFSIAGTTFYQYEDLETGDKVQRKTPFPEEEAKVVGKEPEDGGNDAVSPGSTNFADTGEPAGTSIYGNNGLKSRDFKFGDPEETVNLGEAPRSLFNKWSLHNYANMAKGVANGKNMGPNYNKAVTEGNDANILNPTARRIVNYSQEQGGIGYSYKFTDFAATEHYGQISNEYLITLRRFAYPCAVSYTHLTLPTNREV